MNGVSRLMCRLSLSAAMLCAAAGVTRADEILYQGAPDLTEDPLRPPQLYRQLASITSNGFRSAVIRDLFYGTLIFEYDLSIPLLNELDHHGADDALTYNGFAGVGRISFLFGTIPYGGDSTHVPPVPFLGTRSDDGDAITLSDFRRLSYPAGQIALPVHIFIRTDTVDFTSGTGEFTQDGQLLSSFDTLAPIPVPEPANVVSAAVAGLVFLGYAWRRRGLATVA